MKKSISIFILSLFACVSYAQGVVSSNDFVAQSGFSSGMVSYNGSDNYTLVERTNLRRYDNGKYTGLLSREIRSFITHEYNRNGDVYYSGDFYVSQDTVRAQKIVFTGIHEAIPSRFIINEHGNMQMLEDNGYPSFRSFPSFPLDEVKFGQTWKGESVRAVDPLNNGTITKIPMTILYKLIGEEIYKGEEVYRISAEWATRYGISYWDYDGDRNLKSAQGSHKATILVSKKTGSAIFITDTVDEMFIYADGNKVAYKGTILQFTEYPPSVETEEIVPSLKRIGDVTFEETESGIMLSLHDLKFKADSSELLPGEEKRLDEIAGVLKLVPESMLLVEGHTADTGYAEGEMKLSKERALKIAEELSKRGINPDKFICKGAGATKPVADNSTAEGKARNRRVEITILK